MKTLEANGVRFAYLEQGTGPLVLLVHGFPDTAYTWDATMPAVAAAGFRVVAPFQRGYAPTAVPADGRYDMETLGRDVIALIAALGEERALLVGHDWGASAVMCAAATEPARVQLLVTLAIPHPAGVPKTPMLAWKARHFLTLKRKNAATKLAANDFAGVDALISRWSESWPDRPASESAHVKACFREPGALDAALGYYRQLSFSLPPALRKQIDVPSVAFAGTDDRIVTPRVFEKARTCYAKSYEVVQVPGSHFLHREHPDAFIPELVRVLRGAR
ncbi:MAG TPA: alpha/beta hydrolase [Kofleriaceae bacterium]|jgi:pimeloyl-ACP methyl ester carboxylesterase